ncbi:hypothetical protein C8R45DRAFT_956116 [Mycena sanguinolenta]|nr:hypothetical protein C8R45DRAFT_956116 [Mycena sanguinolenta]
MIDAGFAMRIAERERARNAPKQIIVLSNYSQESDSGVTSLRSQITALELRDRERDPPIHTLPVELLVQIFELAIHDDHTHVEDVLRISQVCLDWRQIAHSTPQLWTGHLWVNLRKPRTSRRRPGMQAYVDGLETWLIRSAPLTVPVSFELLPNREPGHIPEKILGTASRWNFLGMYAMIRVSHSFISQVAQARLDNLEELDLGERYPGSGTNRAEVFDADYPIASFTIVPRLRKLRMHIYPNKISIDVPWAQLTDLRLGAHCANIALYILSQCDNLVRATVSTTGCFSPPEDRQEVPAFTVSHLRALSFPFFGPVGHVMPFLDNLSAPALEELRLDFGHTINPRWSGPHFTSFHQRAPNVTQLELQWSSLTSDELRTAIRCATSLTHLKLDHCHTCFDDALIGALSYKPGVSPLAPCLRQLFLDDIGDKFTPDILAAMIASRWWPEAESRSISPAVARWTQVDVNGRFSPDFAKCLDDLQLPSDVLRYYIVPRT